ncbi:MAG TPA: M48 family metalloprotease [Micromonosporaceae bacterium]
MSSRASAILVLVVLVAAFAALVAVTVPWGERPPSRADQLAALDELPPDQVARGRAFAAARRPASYASMLLTLVLLLALGLTTAGSHIVAGVGGAFGGGWYAEGIVGGLVLILLTSLVSLPFAAWRHRVSRDFGLSTQGWRGWAVDVLKGYAVSVVFGSITLAAFFAVVRAAPDAWWAWAAAGAAALVVLLSFVVPVLVEPVFNKFTAMADSPLRTELLSLAARDGVPVRDVLVADASRRSRAVNAYVSGLGATRRVVVYDTLLTEATEGEVTSVVAHELGHAKDRDVLTGTAVGAVGVAIAVVAIYLIGGWTALVHSAGAPDVANPRALALLMAMAAVAGTVSAPLQNFVSRRVETRADSHALRLTADADTFGKMQARLAAVNLSNVDPRRFEYVVFASHPTTVQRIAAARVFGRGADTPGVGDTDAPGVVPA